MSSRLTLLILCDQMELHPLLISALEAADFRVVRASRKEQATKLLADLDVDAVIVDQSASHTGVSICPALKRVSPQTPILIFAGENQHTQSYPGIYSVLHADPSDELLARAIAMFLRESLRTSPGKQRRQLRKNSALRPWLRSGPQPSA